MKRTAYWRGRPWTIRPATKQEQKTFLDGKDGMVLLSEGTILYNPMSHRDNQVQAVLHEAGHVMFPEWEAEPDASSKSELGVFERDMKGFLESFGVDLSVLVEDP